MKRIQKFTKEQEMEKLLSLELEILRLKKEVDNSTGKEQETLKHKRLNKQRYYWFIRKKWGYAQAK